MFLFKLMPNIELDAIMPVRRVLIYSAIYLIRTDIFQLGALNNNSS